MVCWKLLCQDRRKTTQNRPLSRARVSPDRITDHQGKCIWRWYRFGFLASLYHCNPRRPRIILAPGYRVNFLSCICLISKLPGHPRPLSVGPSSGGDTIASHNGSTPSLPSREKTEKPAPHGFPGTQFQRRTRLRLHLIFGSALRTQKIHHFRTAPRPFQAVVRARGTIHVLRKPPFRQPSRTLGRAFVSVCQSHVEFEADRMHETIGSTPKTRRNYKSPRNPLSPACAGLARKCFPSPPGKKT